MMGPLCIALVLLFATCAFALSEQEYQDSFVAWTRLHNKAYSSSEFSTRYNAFKANLDYINAWNAKGSPTVLGATQFADLTNAEYRELMLGSHFDGTARLKAAKLNNIVQGTPVKANPTSVDWVKEGAVTHIKNQGQCGSCWSFSTTGSVEGIHFLTKQNLVGLSEQNLIDCSTSYGNNGCNGGLMDQAFRYIIANGGIDTEASYPYTMASEPCKYKAKESGASITGFTDVKPAGSESALETATVHQPISVAIDASHSSFQLYESGVYYEPDCSTTALDHGVLVVGYGVDGSKDYWLVKNSWGTTWGQAGYIWMSRNRDNNCGIATLASFPTIKN
eukprot:Phypoly_transcript_12243.p1 GENE.Phypoly_transcript_12243~~Phypoly_transcript_12243.p1  ORF type:complete len:335 (+),score=55.31 Phypoly_transcript_12243:91-1095(+)